MTKAQKAERADSIAKLRDWIKPGDTVYTILDHVSSSGMSRAIRVVLLKGECTRCGDVDCSHVTDTHPNYAVGKVLGLRHWKRNGREQDALVIGGCGMDMGFHLVYELSHALYGGHWAFCPTCNGQTSTNGVRCATCNGKGEIEVGGYACLGKGKCPSNYHSNHRQSESGPERFDLTHTDGYALRHRWL